MNELQQEIYAQIVGNLFTDWFHNNQDADKIKVELSAAVQNLENIINEEHEYITQEQDIRDIIKILRKSHQHLQIIGVGYALYDECLCHLMLENFSQCYRCLDEIDYLNIKPTTIWKRKKKKNLLEQLKQDSTELRNKVQESERTAIKKREESIKKEEEKVKREQELLDRIKSIEEKCISNADLTNKILLSMPVEDNREIELIHELLGYAKRHNKMLLWLLALVCCSISLSVLVAIIFLIN